MDPTSYYGASFVSQIRFLLAIGFIFGLALLFAAVADLFTNLRLRHQRRHRR